MDIASLSGIAPAIQFDRIQSALDGQKIAKAQALALAAEIGLPESMRTKLKDSSVAVVGYAEPSGNAGQRTAPGTIVAQPGRGDLGKEVALRTGRPAVDHDVDPRDDPNYASNLFTSLVQDGVRDLDVGHKLYGRGLAECVLDVANSVPPASVGAFAGTVREATLAALDKAVLGRFRSAVGEGFREPVPSFGDDWHTYTLSPNLRVCDRFSKQLFVAGLQQKLEVVDDAGRVLESVESCNGKISQWTRNTYDDAGNLTRFVKIALGFMPAAQIYEMDDKGFKSALEVHFYGDSSGTCIEVTKRADNGQWVQGHYTNSKIYNMDRGFHDREFAADYGDVQRLDEVSLVTETPTESDHTIRGASSFQDANASLYRGDQKLPYSWPPSTDWDRKVFSFHRNGRDIAGAMTVYRGDNGSMIVEHPGKTSKPEAGRAEFPLTVSFDREILPAVLAKAIG